MAKYKVNDAVRFTLDGHGDPSTDKWVGGAKEGRGIILALLNSTDLTDFDYAVKVTDPPDWEGGHTGGGRLDVPDHHKGYYFYEAALRPAETAQASTAPTKSTASNKSDDDGTRTFFMKTKEEPAVLCPNPCCHGAETERIFFSVVCPICGWTSH